MRAGRFLGFPVISIALYMLVSCAPKNFQRNEDESTACQGFGEQCLTQNGYDIFNYSKTIGGGKVDIVFVDDNSGSMSFEQSQLADRFSSFISNLDGRKIDYRIGVITTDISSDQTESTADNSASSGQYNPPRVINNNGSLQNGELIEFSGGRKFLSSNDSGRVSDFMAIIKRPETLQCESFLKQYPSSQPPTSGMFQNCPSGDERGIFSANLFLTRKYQLLREDADVAFVFLSDEDTRSGLYLNSVLEDFTLELNDRVETFIENSKKFVTGRKVSAHSIIVKPGDTQCEAEQNKQMGPVAISPTYGVTFNQIKGSQGRQYAKASEATGGIIGSICSSDYGALLKDISTKIADQATQISLACASPKNLSVKVDGTEISSWSIDGAKLSLGQVLNIGQKVDLSYSCPRL